MTDEIAVPFSSVEALGFGWAKTKANLRPLLAIGALGAFLVLLERALTTSADDDGLGWLLSLAIRVLQVGVMLIYARVALRVHDGESLNLAAGDLLADFFPYLVTCILQGLIVAVGFVLLIVPGVIWGVKFAYMGFVVIDQRADPIEALRESARLTHGVKWRLLKFGLLCLAVNLVGAIALGIGLFVTIPTTVVAAAYVFRRLQGRVAERSQSAPSAPTTISPLQAPAASH